MSSLSSPNSENSRPSISVSAEDQHDDQRSRGVSPCSDGLPVSYAGPGPEFPCRAARVIVIAEGEHDLEFLRRVSRILHDDDLRLPDLQAREHSGEVILMPSGGSSLCHWVTRLASLGLPEFFIFDRETPSLTQERQQVADRINRRRDCHAVLTGKRAIENYVDSESLREVRGINVDFGDDDDVPALVARHLLERSGDPPWSDLSSRARRRLRNRAKIWLNRQAVSRMTAQRLTARDPDGDIRLWLTTIGWLAGLCQ